MYHAWHKANLKMITFEADYRGTKEPKGLKCIIKISYHFMREKYFLSSLAEIITCQLNNSEYPKMVRDMVTNGNFHRRVFKPGRLFHMVAKNWIRFMMNMAMLMNERDFMQMWQQIGNRIVEAADSYESDYINEEHSHGNH